MMFLAKDLYSITVFTRDLSSTQIALLDFVSDSQKLELWLELQTWGSQIAKSIHWATWGETSLVSTI